MADTSFSWPFLLKQTELASAMIAHPITDVTGFNIDTARRTMPYSDIEAAELMRRHFEEYVSYVPAEDQWYYWNGIIHAPMDKHGSGDFFSRDFAKMFYSAMKDALAFTEEQYTTQNRAGQRGGNALTPQQTYRAEFEQQRKYRDALAKTGGNGQLAAMLKQIFAVGSDFFVNDTRWLVVRNGVFDLLEIEERIRQTGELFAPVLYRHDVTRPVTRYFNADWTPGAARTGWLHFLENSVPDESMRDYLQLLVGAAFAGHAKLKALPNLTGPKNSGKTVFISVLQELGSAGFGYTASPSPEVIMKKDGEAQRHMLRGRRFIALSEPDRKKEVDSSFVKQVTGGDQVTTKELYRNPVSWRPQCVIFIASNDPLKFDTVDAALLDRIQPILFPNEHFMPGDRPDSPYVIDVDLERRLLNEESAGILAWVLLGMMKFFQQRRMVMPPASVRALQGESKQRGSSFARWLNTMLDAGALVLVPEQDRGPYKNNDWVNTREMWTNYGYWCEWAGERRMSKSIFDSDWQKDFQKVRGTGNKSQHARGLVATPVWDKIVNSVFAADPAIFGGLLEQRDS